jgi:hypothetical protein
MTNVTGRGCTRHRHADPMKVYDRLPAEVRRGLAIAPINFCPICVAADMRRHGLEWTVRQLAEARVHERRDGLWLPVEPLRP